jgi:hypothetical protein
LYARARESVRNEAASLNSTFNFPEGKLGILQAARDAVGASGKVIWKSKTFSKQKSMQNQTDDFITQEFFNQAMLGIGGPSQYFDAFTLTRDGNFSTIDAIHFYPDGYDALNRALLKLL